MEGCVPLLGQWGSTIIENPCWLVEAAQKLPKATNRHRLAPSSKSMNSALLLLKKPKRWIWVGIDSNFGKVLGFIYGSRTIKTVIELLQKLNHTGLWNWLPWSLWRFHPRHFSTPWQTLQAPVNPSTLDAGITSLGCTTKHCAIVNPDQC